LLKEQPTSSKNRGPDADLEQEPAGFEVGVRAPVQVKVTYIHPPTTPPQTHAALVVKEGATCLVGVRAAESFILSAAALDS
jgi:hypothetical protein